MMNRRIVLLGTVVLLAGCKVIPKVAPEPVPEPTATPTGSLPTDQARHRVALLVPLTGPSAAVGNSLANASTMALLDTNATNLRITTYDTALGASMAAQQAITDGNKLILGPLLGSDVGAVATVARAAKVPLITYANDAGLAARDVFLMGTVPGNSISRTVRHAAAQGARYFAVIAPQSDFGTRTSAAYTAAVTAVGGTLVATETYARSNPSVISAARRLRARSGIDAVLIADEAKFAVLAAPNLKAAGVAAPRILGPDIWSGESAIASTPALRGAWYSAVSDARYRQFADSYQSRFGTRPFRIATLGYDSVLLTLRVARDWRAGTVFPVGKLNDSGGFLGLDGPFRFDRGGMLERALEVREVRAGGVTIVSAAPARFQD
jgi:branched-chain amino acid transport system substrate-binding protein